MAEAREGRRPLAMDPPHLTEFASKSYFEKYKQQQEQQLQQQEAKDAPSVLPQASAKFILPLRESKAPEQPQENAKATEPKRDKRSFFSIRQKVALLHSKPVQVQSQPAIHPVPARTSTESTVKSIPLDHLFLALPNELQIEIISSLPLNDLLNLRLASKSWHSLITLNETTIVRYHLETQIPAYALRLYPLNEPRDATLHNLCGLWHRLHVAAKLAHLMCEWITKDIFLQQTEAQKLAFAPQTERMRRRLIPLLFTIFHFFETYRKLHLERIEQNGGWGLKREAFTINPIEAQIMSMYDDQTLLRVHEVFPLVISSFCRRLRPPTYVGRVERSLRGYLKEKPSDEVHSAILCIGGLREVEKLWETKGYNSRRAAVDNWYNSLTNEAPPEPTAKPRRGLMSFARRKSTGHDREGRRVSLGDASQRNRSPSGSIDRDFAYDPNWVFNTSLAAGVPMSPLSQDSAQKILDDLPVLQQIWTTTAEALILERRIVDCEASIKRNQHLIIDLIREDGVDEEDEWLYGRHAPDSVKASVAAIHDDVD
ncbi:f-box domain-containing protein [Sarocladium implicatum]|nr:f-box domain-containing protein [Sarocladium implicatum]